MTNIQNLQRIAVASALASGLVSFGVAASAQTAPAPATTTAVSNTASAPVMMSDATSVSMSTVGKKPSRQEELEAINAEARRIAFRNPGMSI